MKGDASMKKTHVVMIAVALVLALSGSVMAVDIDTLDKVSVFMPKSEVIAILGPPDDVLDVGAGLQAEVYKMEGIDPMMGTGCIYDGDRLAGQSFMFAGEMTAGAAERLKKHGFALLEEKNAAYRLLGKDDDTGRVFVVHVFTEMGMTIVMTFEKEFYDRHKK